MRSARHQARLLIECCCNRRRQAWAAFPAADPDFSEAVFLKRQTSSTGAAGIQFFFAYDIIRDRASGMGFPWFTAWFGGSVITLGGVVFVKR